PISRRFVPELDLAFGIPSIHTDIVIEIAFLIAVTQLELPPTVVHFTQVHRRQLIHDAAAARDGSASGDQDLGPVVIEVFKLQIQLVVQERGFQTEVHVIGYFPTEIQIGNVTFRQGLGNLIGNDVTSIAHAGKVLIFSQRTASG